jgi:hypothetical protein
MKNTVRITESQLKQMISESVKKVLKESCLYCDPQPFQEIYAAAEKICGEYEYVNNEDWEPSDDCDGRDLSYDVYSWAERIKREAEYWIQRNSSNTPINGGEDW